MAKKKRPEKNKYKNAYYNYIIVIILGVKK